jgi:hypothetical protein
MSASAFNYDFASAAIKCGSFIIAKYVRYLPNLRATVVGYLLIGTRGTGTYGIFMLR